MFFQIRYHFIDWLFKSRRHKYQFHMTDERYPDSEFIITVERRKYVKQNTGSNKEIL